MILTRKPTAKDDPVAENPIKINPEPLSIDTCGKQIKGSLLRIYDKVLKKERLTFAEGLDLLTSSSLDDIEFVIALADYKRKIIVGDVVFYSSTFYLYPTNLCVFNCSFCSFYAKRKTDPKAWIHTPEELIKQLEPHLSAIREVHIVSGCHPECDLHYYKTLFSLIKKTKEDLHIKGLTAIEYDYLAKLHGISVEDVLIELKANGLDSLPGGGAEILVDEVRRQISPKRLSTTEFLEIHRIAHRLEIRSNITLLFNHLESPREILTHLDLIRQLQDETHGFKTLIPLKFAEYNNALGRLLHRRKYLNQINTKLLFATARLFLDNIHNIKSLWNYLGIETALDLLSCGANDLSTTHIGEKVFQMASSNKVIKMDPAGMESLIVKKGRVPCLTNSKVV